MNINFRIFIVSIAAALITGMAPSRAYNTASYAPDAPSVKTAKAKKTKKKTARKPAVAAAPKAPAEDEPIGMEEDELSLPDRKKLAREKKAAQQAAAAKRTRNKTSSKNSSRNSKKANTKKSSQAKETKQPAEEPELKSKKYSAPDAEDTEFARDNMEEASDADGKDASEDYGTDEDAPAAPVKKEIKKDVRQTKPRSIEIKPPKKKIRYDQSEEL